MIIDEDRLIEQVRAMIPGELPDPIAHAEATVQFPKSARSKHFNCSITPWVEEVIRRSTRCPYTRKNTLVKPVQSGGSVAGEVILADWIQFARGFIQYNWSNDKRAEERWDSRIIDYLEACEPIKARMAQLPIDKLRKGEIDFGNVFFRVQGALTPSNLDSDSITHQINEEVHDWEPGHLQKARNRTTAVWNYKSVDISNAGKKGGQLHKAFNEGTMQWWENKCPGCGLYHRMRTHWDDKQPNLGGLRYDAAKARYGDGQYNYNIIAPTVRFQMPCGYIVHNDVSERRRLSLNAQYGKPTNPGADGTHRSYTYEAVTVDYIDWVQLIKDKHEALRALRLGDPELWRVYRVERECIFYDPDDAPLSHKIVLTDSLKKNREGLPEPKLRAFALDHQRGEAAKGELPHWWCVIRDVSLDTSLPTIRSQLVFEGKLETDEQVIATLKEHGCNMWQGVADSGDDTTHVYLFCLQHGINCIKGGKEVFYSHGDGNKRIFSLEKPLHTQVGRAPLFAYIETPNGPVPHPHEPMFFLYSKSMIRERLHWLRTNTDYRTPDDVSEDYKSHQDAEERLSRRHSITNEVITEWVQLKTRNDQLVNEAYIALIIDQAGMIGIQRNKPNDKNQPEIKYEAPRIPTVIERPKSSGTPWWERQPGGNNNGA